MASITIADSGNPALDGEYPFDTTYLTNRELHVIKEMANVRAGEVEDALSAGDNDLVVALAYIVMRRAGKPVTQDVLWDMPAGKIAVNLDEQEAEEDPPSQAPSDEPESGSAVVRPISSGDALARPSESQENDPSPTGDQTSDTGRMSA